MKNSAITTYIMFTASRRSLSQAKIADRYGISREAVNRVVNGKADFPIVRQSIAQALGHRDWTELTCAAEKFQFDIQTIYNKLSRAQKE